MECYCIICDDKIINHKCVKCGQRYTESGIILNGEQTEMLLILKDTPSVKDAIAFYNENKNYAEWTKTKLYRLANENYELKKEVKKLRKQVSVLESGFCGGQDE
jgi:hypothetical protein